MNALLRRARRLRRRSAGVKVLVVIGGLRPRTQDGNPAHAEVGGVRLQRAADEPFDQFCERVAAAAQRAGDPHPVVGGLPADGVSDENDLRDFEWPDDSPLADIEALDDGSPLPEPHDPP